MNIGWFGRAFNYKHRSLSTKTHVVDSNGKVLCGYKPHPSLCFNWCSSITMLTYLECDRCRKELIKIKKKLVMKKLGGLFGTIGG